MPNKETQRKINEAMNEVRISNRSANVFKSFRCNVHDTDKHIYKMFEIWLENRRLGVPILTEVIFNGGQRADLFFPSLMECTEVVVTESESSIERKKELYPCKINVVKVE